MQIKFVEVSEEELEAQRAVFANGQLALETEEQPFDLAAYNAFLNEVAPEAKSFQAQQQAAAAKQVVFPRAESRRKTCEKQALGWIAAGQP